MSQAILVIGPQASCESIAQLIRNHPQLELAGNIISAGGLYLAGYLTPDSIILDCAAPQINPLVVLPELRALPDAPPIIVLGAGDRAGERSLLRALGATAYATLERPESLLEALAAVKPLINAPVLRQPITRSYASTKAELAQQHAQ